MSKIHISTGNGQSSQYSEEQVRSMLQQGSLRDDALFWKAGMADWQPIRDLFSQTPEVGQGHPPVPHELAASNYTFIKDPSRLTQALKVMLWVQLGVVVISMLSDFGQMSLASSGNITTEAAEANDARQGVIGLLYLGVFIATGILFLKWIYRANSNCRGFGATGMKFTSGWSIGCYFIPFINLVWPYQAMKEIWKVSEDPKNWKARQGSAILRWWWALWLLSNFFDHASFRMGMSVNNPSSLEVATMASIVASIVEIVLIIVAVTLISRIIGKQFKLTQNNSQ